MIKCILMILFSFYFYSCKESTPSGVIKPVKMQEILWDVLKADALAREMTLRDSTLLLSRENINLTKKVFLIHNITQEQFQKSYSYYTQHPDKMKPMLDTLHARQVRAATPDIPLKKEQLVKDSAQINN